MPRYQFEPREGYFLNFEDARNAAKKFGATALRVCAPQMHERRPGETTLRVWRGTNQPKTLCFTLPQGADPMDVQEEYGWNRAFVRERVAT